MTQKNLRHAEFTARLQDIERTLAIEGLHLTEEDRALARRFYDSGCSPEEGDRILAELLARQAAGSVLEPAK